MVVHRTPLQRIALDEAIGLRTVVVVELEDMVQAQWHHVVHASLTTLCHHLCHRVHKLRITGKRLLQPLTGNLVAVQSWVPRQSTKGIPVGLREMVTTPVLVESDIGDTSDTP